MHIKQRELGTPDPICPKFKGKVRLSTVIKDIYKRMHKIHEISKGGCANLKIQLPGAWPTDTRQRQLGTPDLIALKICGQRGYATLSILHQKRMHAPHANVVGGLVPPENPIPRRPIYVHKAAATRNA